MVKTKRRVAKRTASLSLESKMAHARREIRRADGKGFGLGFNGHALRCDCGSCAPLHAKRVTDYLASPTVRLGKPGATVLVRAYLRRGPGHLKRRPEFRAMLRRELDRLRARHGEEV